MGRNAHETIEGRVGLKAVIEYEDYFDWADLADNELMEITYKKSSRYRLGTQGVTADEEEAIRENPDNVCVPVYGYVHSGSTISHEPFGCRWDSGRSGTAYMSRAEYIEHWKPSPDKTPEEIDAAIREVLIGYIGTIDDLLRGNVFCISIEDAEGEVVYSCGMVAGREWAESQAAEMLKAAEEDAIEAQRTDSVPAGSD